MGVSDSSWGGRARRLFRRTGFDIVRYAPEVSFRAQRSVLFSAQRIDVVFDVGANTGQYGAELRADGFGGRIASFEPLRDAYGELQRRAAGDNDWLTFNLALGDAPGEAVINVSGNSQSSSLLPMQAVHRENAPTSAYVGTQTVEVRRIDDVFDEVVPPGARPFLKLDVQGFGRQVLAGAAASLDRVTGIQFEASLVELYEGEQLFPEMLSELAARGFNLVAIAPVFMDASSGRLLQLDAVAFRE
ncbi:MAG: FkbM family methyltransferase [Actinobacteria bacterium]|nr:FkbM family methyltransferase [Actinomycetota bacterium]